MKVYYCCLLYTSNVYKRQGKWTVEAAMELNVPAHVITASLYTRFQSRQDDSFAMKGLASLRKQCGGHAVKKEAQQ